MTPPRLDVDACQEKVALLADLVADLERHVDVTGGELRADRDRRHVVERILTHLVNIAGGLNSLLARGLGHRTPTVDRDGFELSTSSTSSRGAGRPAPPVGGAVCPVSRLVISLR